MNIRPIYNFDTTYYSIIRYQKVFTINAQSKPLKKKPPLEITLRKIGELVGLLQKSGSTITQIQNIKLFLSNYTHKIEQVIQRENSFLGGLIILISYLFGIGALGRLASLTAGMNSVRRIKRDKIHLVTPFAKNKKPPTEHPKSIAEVSLVRRIHQTQIHLVAPVEKNASPTPTPSPQSIAKMKSVRRIRQTQIHLVASLEENENSIPTPPPQSIAEMNSVPQIPQRKVHFALPVEKNKKTAPAQQPQSSPGPRTISQATSIPELLERKKLSSEDCNALLTRMKNNPEYKDTVERYEQLQKIRFEKKLLLPYKALRLAHFIQTKVLKRKQNHYFSRKQTHLPRSIQFDKRMRDIYILSIRKLALMKNNEGSFKKLATCIRLPSERTKEPTVDVYLLTKTDDMTREQVDEDLADIHRELKYCEKFIGQPGLAQFRTWTAFVDAYTMPRFSMIFERYDGNLHQLYTGKKKLSSHELLTVIVSLLKGLAYLHKNRIIHTDIKLNNALFTKKNSKVIDAVLCDFGLCFTLNTSEKAPIYYKWGHSSTPDFSPPELYGVRNFKGDYYAIDAWCLGYALYQLYFDRDCPWERLLTDSLDNNFDYKNKCYKDPKALKIAQNEFKTLVESSIEKPLKELESKKSLSPTERLEKLIYSLLRKDPTKRFSAPLALQEANKLLKAS